MRLALIAILGFAAFAQEDRYTGPKPPKTDVPFLLHANNLVELDSANAEQSERKDDTVFTVPGTASKAQTPMAEPIFIIAAQKIQPEKLDMFRMAAKGNTRELAIPKKPKRDSPRPVRLTAKKLDGNLYRLEVQEFLDNGEYCMSPQGANTVFCFAVF